MTRPKYQKKKDNAAPVILGPGLAPLVEHPAQRRFMGATDVSAKKRLRYSEGVEVLVPEGLKVQVGPAFTDSRYSVDKVAQPFFSAMKPGQYPLGDGHD